MAGAGSAENTSVYAAMAGSLEDDQGDEGKVNKKKKANDDRIMCTLLVE